MENLKNQKNIISARLADVEEGTAYFVSDLNNEEIIPWPATYLPEGIEIGDNVNISIDFEMGEKRLEELKEKAANELKYNEMRKMLEELVN
ncbi:hypothetical protein JW911_02170 [Candidatus Peregrinibacteria bacterium]|nr:hypothetical protein [Candidatus Peregrinibacteria bacterium]